MTVYRCAIDEGYSSFKELKERHVVAQGWSDIGDVSFFTEEDDIKKYTSVIPKDGRNERTIIGMLSFFTKEARPGDIIIGTTGGTIMGICELPERFTYAYLPGDDYNYEYAHCIFPVEWVPWSEVCTEFSIIKAARASRPLAKTNDLEIHRVIEQKWQEKRAEVSIQPPECDEELRRLMEAMPQKIEASRERFRRLLHGLQAETQKDVYAEALKRGHNLILTGAPGTGKTYLARELASKLIFGKAYGQEEIADNAQLSVVWNEQQEFVQFHPSYDYTDFVEGLRPMPPDDSGNVRFGRKDGIFKDFCRRALKATLEQGQDNFEDAWQRLMDYLDDQGFLEVTTLNGNNRFEIEQTESGSGLASHSYDSHEDRDRHVKVPGKSKFFNREQLYRVYRGLAGVPKQGFDNYRRAIVNTMKQQFGLVDFKAGQRTVASSHPYVFIIDEINRGDIAKIFGELFFSVDPGYRGTKGTVKTQYQNLIEEDDVFYHGFYIPENVYVIGTMNDIDRNVESMDFAIRRRFTWMEVKPEDTVGMWDDIKHGIADYKKSAASYMRLINEAICNMNGLGPAYQLGASYFLKLKEYDGDFNALWTYHVEPLLREYLRGLPNAQEDLETLRERWHRQGDETEAENESQEEQPTETDRKE